MPPFGVHAGENGPWTVFGKKNLDKVGGERATAGNQPLKAGVEHAKSDFYRTDSTSIEDMQPSTKLSSVTDLKEFDVEYPLETGGDSANGATLTRIYVDDDNDTVVYEEDYSDNPAVEVIRLAGLDEDTYEDDITEEAKSAYVESMEEFFQENGLSVSYESGSETWTARSEARMSEGADAAELWGGVAEAKKVFVEHQPSEVKEKFQRKISEHGITVVEE